MTITDAAELLAMDAAARRLSPLTLDFYRTRTKVIAKIVALAVLLRVRQRFAVGAFVGACHGVLQ
jgi:hypothetical protein